MALPIVQTTPDVGDLEADYMLQALRSGSLAGGGSFTASVCAALAQDLGCADVVLTTSGTDALELGALLLNLGPGDVVILPSFTFASVATAFVRTGAKLRFADIERETLGIDPDSVRALLDDSVRAVVPVHYGGIACDLDGLLQVLAPYQEATLVEDNAHGLYGTLSGRALGTFGPIGATSFHATKTLTCGEGGALLIADPDLVDRAHILAEKGTNRREFLAGRVDKYTWRDIGSSFILAEPLAAILLAQLERRHELFKRRGLLYDTYFSLLRDQVGRLSIALPGARTNCVPIPHLFYVLVETAAIRDSVIRDLEARGIGVTFHYLPLHTSSAAPRFLDRPTECPVTSEISDRLLRLPFHSGMTETDAERVVKELVASVERNA